MSSLKILSIGFICIASFSISAEAKLYKWVDDKGTTHYGEIIPPEFANKERDSLDKAGMIQKRPEKVDPETIRAKKEAEDQRKIEDKAAMEQQRRDSTLLNTYSNEKEIDMARDRSLVLINARIESYNLLLKSSQESLNEQKAERDNLIKQGKNVYKSLANDIDKSEARVDKYADELTKSQEELIAVKARFENEKLLYRKLKTGQVK